MPSDPADSLITGAMVGGGESREHIEYNVQTQVAVPILQDLALIATVVIIAAGLFLLGGGLLDVARMCETPGDLALFACFITIGLTVTIGLGLAVIRKVARVIAWKPPWWFPAAAYLFGFVWVMALLNLIRLADGNWTAWDTVRIVGALALICGVPFLTYRFFRELLNPKYPPSPTTEAILELIRSRIQKPEPERVMVRRPIPVNAGNHRAEMDWMREAEPEPQAAEETLIDEDFVDMMAMVRRAVTVGWARTQWLTRPRLTMPSGRRMDRGLYDALTDLAARPWRIIAKAGKPGVTPEWLMEPQVATALLERVYAAQFGVNGGVLPIEGADGQWG